MDRNFTRALALVLESEGGWSDKKADPGGATMKGVTLANFRRYVKPDAGKADLKKISDAQVATVYRRFYWDAVAGAELPDGIDYAVFDFAVNSGPGRAAKYLQAVLGVAQDGRIGPATLAAARAKPAGVVIDTLCDARLAFLERLPTWPTFGKGWGARVASVRAEALLISAQPAVPSQPSLRSPEPDVAPSAVAASRGHGVPPATPSAPPAKAAGIFALVALVLGSAAAWFAHLPCHLLGAFCQ
ncbi:glycosyl hydrolase 108 family protein [Mesorhizobium sp. WSM4904]|uniref:glycoside hydrolase family 108 protein n=1 Tax=Mesorhizobium sp. WSM4904 TaxID=3038545 RepID=UPI00241897A6|nr:glycosyl hydrolase 108 family protein [Mesorhizobium sp. WSM4904]WFP61478.1 glycosyl hydrolase 108 family protein [Mesorhizobium sp. WSM4904]